MKRQEANQIRSEPSPVFDAASADVRKDATGLGASPVGGMWSNTQSFNLVLAALFILLVLIRVYYFNRFWVPDSDFFDLQRTARALLQFELPPSFQRLPLFSAAMALLSPLLPGRNAILLAGEVISFASFIAAAILLYRIALRLSGPSIAFTTVCLFGLHPDTVMLTTKPVAHMSSIALVLFSIYLSLRERRTAYVAAGLASLGRYEGAFLIPALAAKDLLFGRRKWEAVALAGVASMGLLGWLALNYAATGHINPYFSYMSEPAAGLRYVRVVFQSLTSFSDSLGMLPQKPLGIALLGFVALGFWSWFRRPLADVLPIAFFLVACTALNLIFFSATPSHVFVTLWIFLMAVSAGAGYGFELASRWFVNATGAIAANRPAPFPMYLGLIGIAALGVGWILYHRDAMQVTVLWIGSFSVVTAFIVILSRRAGLPGLVAASIALCFVFLLLGGNARVVVQRMNKIQYTKASLRLVGEWYEKHARSGERLVVSEPWVVQEYAPVEAAKNILPLSQFRSMSPEEFEIDLEKTDAQYVVWNSHHGRLPPGNFYYRKYRMDLIVPLAYGRDWGQFEFLETVGVAKDLAHIYRFRR